MTRGFVLHLYRQIWESRMLYRLKQTTGCTRLH